MEYLGLDILLLAIAILSFSPFVLADSLKIIVISLLLFIIASYVPILITSPVVLLICFELVVDSTVTYVGVFSLCHLPDWSTSVAEDFDSLARNVSDDRIEEHSIGPILVVLACKIHKFGVPQGRVLWHPIWIQFIYHMRSPHLVWHI